MTTYLQVRPASRQRKIRDEATGRHIIKTEHYNEYVLTESREDVDFVYSQEDEHYQSIKFYEIDDSGVEPFLNEVHRV